MKRILAVLLAVMLLVAVIPATSLAAGATPNSCAGEYQVYRVNTNGGRLNLRTGAGTHYKIITSLCYGKPVKLIKKCGDWYKVQTFNGVTGWASKRYLKCGAYANVATKSTGLNYRTGPGMSYSVKGSFPKGTKHLLVTKVRGNWAYVTKCSKKGWSSLSYLKWAY